MKFEVVRSQLEGIPYIDPKRAQVLYNFIIENKPSECLELGFAHGVSSCYIAAALDELGAGRLTSVDLIPSMTWQDPAIEELLTKTGLAKYVSVKRERTTYTWFLKKMIEKQSSGNNCQPIYDFCFIDGPKNWTIDSSAFFLADKLLKEGGWILFDDFGWKYGNREQMYGIPLEDMGDDERNTPHIERIFKLLVMQHPNYSEFRVEEDDWAWARKVASPSKTLTLKETTVQFDGDNHSNTTFPARVLHKLANLF